MRPLVRCGIVAAVSSMALVGCTIVELHNGSVTERRLLPGLTILEIQPHATAAPATSLASAGGDPAPQAPLVVNQQGFGLLVDRRSVTLGWSRQQTILIPDPHSCQVVFFVEDAEQIASAERILNDAGGAGGICDVSPVVPVPGGPAHTASLAPVGGKL